LDNVEEEKRSKSEAQSMKEVVKGKFFCHFLKVKHHFLVHMDKSKEDVEPELDDKDAKVDTDKMRLTNEVPTRDPEDQFQSMSDTITFSDVLNKDIYAVDYSLSHPMENECRFPILIKGKSFLALKTFWVK
jgi:hypothetical protein